MREELYLWKYKALAEKLAKEMKRRHFEVHIVNSKEELLKKVRELVPEGSTVANGGSLTLIENGVLDIFRNGNYVYYDRYAAKTPEERRELELKAFTVDYYLSGANAITEDGRLVFLDGNGNRVAAIVYGPKNVIIVSSVNKVVKSMEDARERLRFISPMNSKRLNLSTPCVQKGFCYDCASSDRICNYFVVVESSARIPGRIKVILTTFETGL
ncbi:MAG: lactate utilization protein [Fervidobacterium pennivorans]|jgi:L-lactate utilization protein LutB